MKTVKIITLLLALSVVSLKAYSQQAPMFTHYMYNTLMVNPAYAGSRDALTITALHRSQWVDYSGAPITQTLTMHAPIYNEHMGIGLSIMNDKIGPSNNTALFFNYAYIMKLTTKSKLAFGLSAGVNLFQANLNSLEINQPNDPAFQNNINRRPLPNFGFGAYYSRERFYVGLSAPNLLQNNYSAVIQDNGNTLVGKENRHYFLIAGTLIHLSDNLDLKPTTLIKLTPAAPIQADITASLIILNKLSIGAMFRTGDAFGALVGVLISDQLNIGYSYDWSYGLQTSKYNQGSHELVLRYDFIFNSKKQIHSPRNF